MVEHQQRNVFTFRNYFVGDNTFAGCSRWLGCIALYVIVVGGFFGLIS